MRRPVYLGVAGVLLLSGFAVIALAQARISQLEAWKPHTPTRLEWITVELNAGFRVPPSADPGYSMDFVPIEKEDAILIYVKYLPSVDREIMNMAINTARNVVSVRTKSMAWSSWLKVKEQVEMARLK